jgi:hypothetical protein
MNTIDGLPVDAEQDEKLKKRGIVPFGRRKAILDASFAPPLAKQMSETSFPLLRILEAVHPIWHPCEAKH